MINSNPITTATASLNAYVERELTAAAQAEFRASWTLAWSHLERAHILSLPSVRLHTWVHARMLRLAIRRRDIVEVFGQIIRVVIAPLSSALGRSPVGNDGRARTPLTRPMPLDPELEAILREPVATPCSRHDA